MSVFFFMLAIFSITLFALPTTQQLLIYFGLIFVPLEIALFLSDTSVGFSLLITLSFGSVFILSYEIAKRKNKLNYRSTQNAKNLPFVNYKVKFNLSFTSKLITISVIEILRLLLSIKPDFNASALSKNRLTFVY